jgi:peptidoglycan hydrolase-like protein with peptidoglycan-binding domain
MRARRVVLSSLALAAVLAAPSAAHGAGYTNVQIAGLQVALQARGVYTGPVDGVSGPETARAVRIFQRQRGLRVDGIAGPRTRAALGKLGRPLFGRRILKRGRTGWDVSVLQFLLDRRGLLGCELDGRFGGMTARAVRRFQRRNGLAVDGIVGPATFAKLDPSGTRAPLQRTRRPKLRRYVVRPGDSLTAIADRHGTTVRALARVNGIDPARVLLIGKPLRIPVSTSRTTVPPASPSRAFVRRRLDFWAGRYGIEPRLVRAVAWIESGYQPHVVSNAGAVGVMQVTSATWEFVETVVLGRKVPRTVDGNIRVGAAFLDNLIERFDGNVRKALAAYHQGPHSVRTRGLFVETKRYVADVLAMRRRV